MGRPAPLPFDGALLARMTGRLGDRETIEAQTAAISAAVADILAAEMAKSASVAPAIACGTIEQGARGAMAALFDESDILCEASIGGWCTDLLLAADAPLVIAVTERLLGGGADEAPASRPLSEIEQDVSRLLFEAFAEALRQAVAPQAGKGQCATPFPGPLKRESDASSTDYAGVLTLDATLGAATYRLRAMLPQSVVLKTSVARQEPKQSAERPKHWTEQLNEKVHKSNVGIEARIRLAPISLETASRLQPGSVIPFADEKDVRVLLRANGKDLFWCEMGKSGERYMVRLQEPHGSEEDFMKELTA